MGQATLTFGKDRYFYLKDGVEFLGWAAIDRVPLAEWERIDSLNYRTSSLKAAARFREYADEITERVFTRAFSKSVPPPPCRLPSFLDPHQIDGVMWILTRTRSYLAHAPGAGKTCEAIVASLMISVPFPTVFIVPPSLTLNWEREILKFTRGHIANPTIGIVGTTATRHAVDWKAQFLIVPDSMLDKPWVYSKLLGIAGIKLLAVDEASRFKDPLASRSKALFGGKNKYRTYPGLIQRAGRVVLLDGSPMPNRPMELWAPTYACDPEAIDCMDQRDFGFRYCGPTQNYKGQWEFRGSSHEFELRERLQKRFMHVVLEEQLEHPERRRSLLFMNQDVRTATMKEWERKNLKLLKTEDGVSEELSHGEIAEHRRELGIKKIPWVVRYILNRMEEKNEKILLFAWHRDVCEGLARGLVKHLGLDRVGLVMGGTPAGTRETYFTDFQQKISQRKIIVGNIAAMGRGHNLQRADRVVFAEPSWSDELNKQCEKRASRRGRDRDLFVRCEYICCPDSLDERVMRNLFTKEARTKRVIG